MPHICNVFYNYTIELLFHVNISISGNKCFLVFFFYIFVYHRIEFNRVICNISQLIFINSYFTEKQEEFNKELVVFQYYVTVLWFYTNFLIQFLWRQSLAFLWKNEEVTLLKTKVINLGDLNIHVYIPCTQSLIHNEVFNSFPWQLQDYSDELS